MADLDRFRELLVVKHDKGSTFEALCPAHDDRNASLTASIGDHGGIVLHCHAGCSVEDVVKVLGLTMAALAGEPYLVESYPYQNVAGDVLWWQDRYANPKTFRARQGLPPPAGRVLYNLPWVVWAVAAGETIYIVEGERDVESLRKINVVATTNVNGAGPGKWLGHYADVLAGAELVIVADNDKPGIAHARAVYAAVAPVARTVALMHTRHGKDVSELLGLGYGLDQLVPLPLDRGLPLVQASSVLRRKVEWAWEGYVPFRGITILSGDPGQGKSTITVDLAARLSSGLPMPDGSAGPGRCSVVMVSVEDDPGMTIRPRLEAAGADLDRVWLIADDEDDDSEDDDGEDTTFTLSKATITRVKETLEADPDIMVIFLDPVSALWPSSINSYVDADVRRALRPLARLARIFRVAIVLVRHLTKSATKALHAGSGSVGITAAARAEFIIKTDPEDPTRQIMACTKSNLAVRPPSLALRLVSDLVDPDVGKIAWDGVANTDADTLFESEPDRKSTRDSAGEWLLQALDGEMYSWRELCGMAKANGFSARTLERARDDQPRVKSAKNPAVGEVTRLGTFWFLDQPPAPETADTDSDISPRLRQLRQGNGVAKLAELAESPENLTHRDQTSGDGEPADFADRPLICDQCGLENDAEHPVLKVFHPPWFIRCQAHYPYG